MTLKIGFEMGSKDPGPSPPAPLNRLFLDFFQLLAPVSG